jgi:hypothetical protein
MTYWYTRIVPRTAKPYTIAGYNAKVNQYIIPLLGHHRLDKLTPEHIEDAWDRPATRATRRRRRPQAPVGEHHPPDPPDPVAGAEGRRAAQEAAEQPRRRLDDGRPPRSSSPSSR